MKSAMGTRSLVNNASIVPKLPMLFSTRTSNPLAAMQVSLDNQTMPIYLKLITFMLGTLIPFAFAQGQTENPGDDTAPARHSAGSLDDAELLLLQLEANAELISLELEETAFFLIFRPGVAPVPVGNLVIMPDTGVGVGWAEQGTAISRYLSAHGWNTLILQPPSPPNPALPKRTLPSMRAIRAGTTPDTPPTPQTETEPTQSGSEDTAEATPEMPFADQVRQRLSLARTELQQRSHEDTEINAILGIGSSALWAAALAAELGDEWDLVMINPRPSEASEANLIELLPRIKGRIIDLYYLPLPGYPEAAPDAQLRRQLVIRTEMLDYHQSRLPGVFRGWQHEMPQLVRQLRGIMERILLAEPKVPESKQLPAPENQTAPGMRNPRPASGPGAV
ncbi:MAG: DUF3530 family protein [Marinobacterium sp.]